MFEYNSLGNKLRDIYECPYAQLTNYGTFFYGDNEYSFEDLEKTLNHDYHSYLKDFLYNENNQWFELVYRVSNQSTVVHIIEIRITEKQKELIKNGLTNDNIDNSIQRLMQIASRKERDKKKEKIDRKVQKTGELPSNNEEIKLYAEYLEEKFTERKAEIAKLCRKLSLAPVFTSLTAYGFITSDEILLSLLGAVTSMGLFYLDYIRNGELANLRNIIKESEIIYYKLLLLDEKVQELTLEKKKPIFNLSEAPKVKKHSKL